MQMRTRPSTPGAHLRGEILHGEILEFSSGYGIILVRIFQREGDPSMDMVNRLIQIAKGISLSLGETCEAVVHDGDHRIAFIANGHISGREQGQQMEESVFKYFEDETRANNGTVVRLTRKNNGELHKSTTMMFFDENGAYEAMLCFTVNLTALDQAKKMLDSLMNVMPFESPEAMGSDLTIADYSKLVIADIIKTVGKPSALGSKEVKLRILRKLEEKGVFQLKDSVPQVCELLDISQATLYNYLREIRTQGSGFLPLSQK